MSLPFVLRSSTPRSVLGLERRIALLGAKNAAALVWTDSLLCLSARRTSNILLWP